MIQETARTSQCTTLNDVLPYANEVKTGNQTKASSVVIPFNMIQPSFCNDVSVYYSPAKLVNEKIIIIKIVSCVRRSGTQT